MCILSAPDSYLALMCKCVCVRLGRECATHQSAFGLDQGPVLSVHLVVEAAGVAEVVACSISPPERGGGRTTVHTLTALCAEFRWRETKGNFI